MKQRINNILYALGGASSVTTLYSFHKELSKTSDVKLLADDITNRLTTLESTISDSTIIPDNSKGRSFINSFKDIFKDWKDNRDIILKKLEDVESGKLKENKEDLYKELAENADWSYRKSIELAENYDKSLDSVNNIISTDFINNLFTEYLEFIDTLPLLHKLNIFHISIFIVIFFGFLNILISFYGIILINKIQWFKKYIWLDKLVQLRNQFQTYYIIFNSIIIFIALGMMLYINILSLLH